MINSCCCRENKQGTTPISFSLFFSIIPVGLTFNSHLPDRADPTSVHDLAALTSDGSLANCYFSFTSFCSVIQQVCLRVSILFFSLLDSHTQTHTKHKWLFDSSLDWSLDWMARQSAEPCLHEVLSPPPSIPMCSQTVNQTGWRLSGVPIIKTS